MENYKENRPWGSFEILEEGLGYKVKRITVNPKQSLSLQYHEKRDEIWIPVRGMAKYTIGTVVRTCDESSDPIYIPSHTKHRVENDTSNFFEFIEVQRGLCLESDIIRLEDKYGRNE